MCVCGESAKQTKKNSRHRSIPRNLLRSVNKSTHALSQLLQKKKKFKQNKPLNVYKPKVCERKMAKFLNDDGLPCAATNGADKISVYLSLRAKDNIRTHR